MCQWHFSEINFDCKRMKFAGMLSFIRQYLMVYFIFYKVTWATKCFHEQIFEQNRESVVLRECPEAEIGMFIEKRKPSFEIFSLS